MADEIVQQLGFDASQALNTLRQLDGALANLEQRFTSLSGRVRDFNGSGGRIAASFGQADAAAATTNQRVERLTVTWETLARVVATQFVVRSLSALRNELDESIDSAIKFQTQIALIQTIANDSLGSFDNVAASVRSVSDAFNIPLEDTGAGLYETISSQIAEGAESIQFLEDSARFAKGTMSTLDQSVSLLSGTLNAFDKDASEAGDVAAKFFVTIDVGNTTASELATSFGRITTQGRQLGITLEELQASVATLTIRGLKTSEAITQIRGVMTGLQKPSDAMKEALRDIGAENAQLAIDSLGLSGAIQAVIATTDGTSEAIARLFPNVRGLGGALSIGALGAETYAKNLERIQNATSELNEEKALEVLQTDAQKVAGAANRLKNAFTVDFGQSIIGVGAAFTDLVGGADSFISVGRVLVPLVESAGVALTIYGANALLTANNLQKLQAANAGLIKGLGPVGLALTGAFAAASIGSTIGSFIDSQFQRDIEARARATQAELNEFSKTQREKVREAQKADREIIQSASNRLRELNLVNQDELDAVSKANSRLISNVEDDLAEIVKFREDVVAELGKAIQETQAQQIASQNRVVQLQQRIEDKAFDKSIQSLNDAQQVFALTARAQQLAGQAAQQLSTAQTPDQIAKALEAFGRAEQAADSAEQIADRTNNRSLEARAAKSVLDVLNQQIQAEGRLRDAQDQVAQDRRAELDRQKAILADLRESVSEVLANVGVGDEDGFFTDQQIKDRGKKLESALQDVVRTAFRSDDLDISELLGLTRLSLTPTDLNVRILGGQEEVFQNLEQSLSRFRAEFTAIGELENVAGSPIKSMLQLQNVIRGSTEEVNNLRRAFATSEEAQLQIKASREEAARLLALLSDDGWSRFGLNSSNIDQFDKANQIMAKFREEARALLSSDSISAEAVNDLVDRMRQFEATLPRGILEGGRGQVTGLQKQLEVATATLIQFKSIADSQTQIISPAALERLQQLQTVLPKFGEAASGLGEANNAASGMSSHISDAASNASRLEVSSRKIAENFERAGAAQPAVAQRFGGSIYRAGGGFIPRGTDTIPAMLSPGEFVVNAASSRRFFSQLQAINAGVQPTYRESGGSTTTYGDISINVNESKTPNATARAIMAEFKREMRRGSGSL